MQTFHLTFLCQRAKAGKFREFDEGQKFLNNKDTKTETIEDDDEWPTFL